MSSAEDYAAAAARLPHCGLCAEPVLELVDGLLCRTCAAIALGGPVAQADGHEPAREVDPAAAPRCVRCLHPLRDHVGEGGVCLSISACRCNAALAAEPAITPALGASLAALKAADAASACDPGCNCHGHVVDCPQSGDARIQELLAGAPRDLRDVLLLLRYGADSIEESQELAVEGLALYAAAAPSIERLALALGAVSVLREHLAAVLRIQRIQPAGLYKIDRDVVEAAAAALASTEEAH